MKASNKPDNLLENEEGSQPHKKRRNELTDLKSENHTDSEMLPSNNEQAAFTNPPQSLNPRCDKEQALLVMGEDRQQDEPLERIKKEEEINVKQEVISPEKNLTSLSFHNNDMEIKTSKITEEIEVGSNKDEELTLKEKNIAECSNGSGTLKTKRFDEGCFPYKKGSKSSKKSKGKNLNTRLSKLLMPKNAVIFLNEFRPGCTYNVRAIPGCTAPQFVADVEEGGQILGTGRGFSKSQCKATAAENAVKTLVVNLMNDRNLPTVNDEVDSLKTEDSGTDLPWASLASYALFKLFKDWQKEGMTIPIPGIMPKEKSGGPGRESCKLDRTKPLPSNAQQLHPTTLLNLMMPGILATELQREQGLVSRVLMGYKIDGKTYVGEGTNKKDAKKKAAESVLSALWGVTYTTGSQ